MALFPIFTLLLVSSTLAALKSDDAVINKGGLEQEIEEAFAVSVLVGNDKKQINSSAFTTKAGFRCEKKTLLRNFNACINEADEALSSSVCDSESSKINCWRDNLRRCWTPNGAFKIYFGYLTSNLDKYTCYGPRPGTRSSSK